MFLILLQIKRTTLAIYFIIKRCILLIPTQLFLVIFYFLFTISLYQYIKLEKVRSSRVQAIFRFIL
jgi:hypothetical protein